MAEMCFKYNYLNRRNLRQLSKKELLKTDLFPLLEPIKENFFDKLVLCRRTRIDVYRIKDSSILSDGFVEF